jgi:hypothetical protein
MPVMILNILIRNDFKFQLSKEIGRSSALDFAFGWICMDPDFLP